MVSTNPSASGSAVFSSSAWSFATDPFVLEVVYVASSHAPKVMSGSYDAPSVLVSMATTPKDRSGDAQQERFPEIMP